MSSSAAGSFSTESRQSGYNLPGSVFDKEFRCAFELLARIPTEADPNISVKEQFFTFNNEHPFDDQVHIVDRDLRHRAWRRVSAWACADGLALCAALADARSPAGRAAHRGVLLPDFFKTEFWLLWSTIMGSLPQHSVIEFRRYMNRFVYLFPDLSTMAHVMRSPFNQHEAFVKPLVAWLTPQNVNFVTGAVVKDIGFEPVAWPHHRQPARLPTEWRDNIGRRRAGGHRARDHRVAGRRPFHGSDEDGAGSRR